MFIKDHRYRLLKQINSLPPFPSNEERFHAFIPKRSTQQFTEMRENVCR